LYEEGVPLRDFVHVSDVVEANIAALSSVSDDIQVVNVGSGMPLSLREVAYILCSVLQVPPNVELTTRFRVGDILGCYANLDRSSRLVGSEKRVAFRQGLRSVLPWLEVKEIDDRSEQVEAELREKGILKEAPPEKSID
jgi:dTDP-L-rhamnose 4-epimerase